MYRSRFLATFAAFALAWVPVRSDAATEPVTPAKKALEKGLTFQKQGKYEQAIEVLEDARQLDAPEAVRAEILVELAETFFRKGKDALEGELENVDPVPVLEESLRRFKDVIEQYPNVMEQAAIAAYMIGSSHLMLGKMDAALAAYKQAYLKYPESDRQATALIRVGVCLAAIGETPRATQIFEAFLRKYPENKSRNKVKKYIQQLKIVGKPANPIHATTWLNGAAPRGLDDLKGEVVVVVFFATWCKHCSKEFPHLKREITRWGERGVVFLGVSDPNDPKATEPVDFFVKRHEVNFFDVALDHGGRNWRPYRVTGLPATAVIDRKGIVRWRGHFAFMGHTLLEKLLNE